IFPQAGTRLQSPGQRFRQQLARVVKGRGIGDPTPIVPRRLLRGTMEAAAVNRAGRLSRPTRGSTRLIEPRFQLRSLRLLQAGHLHVAGPVGGSEWRWRIEVRAAQEDDIDRHVVGSQLDDPTDVWEPVV